MLFSRGAEAGTTLNSALNELCEALGYLSWLDILRTGVAEVCAPQVALLE